MYIEKNIVTYILFFCYKVEITDMFFLLKKKILITINIHKKNKIETSITKINIKQFLLFILLYKAVPKTHFQNDFFLLILFFS